jgi:hypothetical protein
MNIDASTVVGVSADKPVPPPPPPKLADLVMHGAHGLATLTMTISLRLPQDTDNPGAGQRKK